MFERLRTHVSAFFDKVSRTELKGENLQSPLEEFKLTLLENDVAFPVADYICAKLKERVKGLTVPRFSDVREPLRRELHEVLLEVLKSSERTNLIEIIDNKRKMGEPASVVFVGINGTGKTTTIAKVGYLLLRKGYSIVLACSDTYRTGSIEQLEEHARRIGVKTIRHKYGADAAAVAFDAISYGRSHGINVVLIDTAGRMQTNRNLMEELKKIKRVVKPDFTILTVDSLTGNDAVTQAQEFDREVGIDATILTKVDADVKGGAALSVSYVTHKPIVYVGTGQRYEDLKPFEPEWFVKTVLD